MAVGGVAQDKEGAVSSQLDLDLGDSFLHSVSERECIHSFTPPPRVPGSEDADVKCAMGSACPSLVEGVGPEQRCVTQEVLKPGRGLQT